ncbi:hypothetical protein E8D34_10700 [Nocardioides sp. GY 10113]|nr:hypothetical protein E8D34_10700 [Nocardioides sp. GY 10113]
MAFERMVHDESFVSELLTRAVGLLGLERPKAVRIRSGKDAVAVTASELAAADLKARHAGEATMLFSLRVPFLHLEKEAGATDVRPDFAIVVPQSGSPAPGSWLVMGDAKDFERVRARIDDGRMLKGFLQVALGAESAAAWSKLPRAMAVHRFGVLAVPRNAYLRPEAVVEDLADHRREVRVRVEERIAALGALQAVPSTPDELRAHVDHVAATYDPTTCPTCSLFRYCRGELRGSGDPTAVLTEIGVRPAQRAAVLGLVDGTGVAPPPSAPASLVAAVEATVSGLPVRTGRLRIDAVGQPGCINVVAVKSDAAALGVHGIAVQRIDGSGTEPWQRRTFERTNATETRHAAMSLLGAGVREVLAAGHGPVHLVVPDKPTADLLVSIADSLAGVELSRLRWLRDLAEGREILTFDGEPATLPDALDDDARTAVSLLLEEDRARAFGLRQPVVDLRAVVTTYLTPGGPRSDAGRLDYLLAWAEATTPLEHRAVTDAIADGSDTPGARLSTELSDQVHDAGRPGRGDPVRYQQLVDEALDYRIDVLNRSVAFLDTLPNSRLRPAYRALEQDAQTVWGRRLALQASDLVRFSRTYRYWRNAQVDMLDADRKCRDQLAALVDDQVAHDRAADAGVRELAVATVVGLAPLRLEVASRQMKDGSVVVLLHGPSGPAVEGDVDLTVQATSFKLGRMAIGRLTDDGEPGLLWEPVVTPALALGDRVVLGDAEWLGGGYKSGHEMAIKRPGVDGLAAPGQDCTPDSYATDPAGHQWCCRPHEAAEAEWSDTIAERRSRGELNPEVWPPVIDEERFDPADGEDPVPGTDPGPVPADLTLDDLD